MRKPNLGFAAAIVLLLAVVSLPPIHVMAANPANDSEQQFQVNIDNFSFTPAILTMPVAAKVTWTNKDDVPHSVVSINRAFPHSPALDTDESFSYVFATPGTYEYYCSVHPKMVAKIVVR